MYVYFLFKRPISCVVCCVSCVNSHNWIKNKRVMCDCFKNAKAIYHGCRVNHFREQVENWFVDRLTIIGVSFGGFKRIVIKTNKFQQICQPCVSDVQSSFVNKRQFIVTPTR